MNMKAAASLTGSLLARKGAAYPAAYSAPSTAPDAASPQDSGEAHPERAYNDPRVIASAPPQPASPQPATPASPAPQAPDGGSNAGPAQSTAPGGPAVAAPMPATESEDSLSIPQVMDKMGRVRLSVRLDPDRYLRVKMASARTRWSAQDIVIAALDRYLGGSAAAGSKAQAKSDAADSEDDDGVN